MDAGTGKLAKHHFEMRDQIKENDIKQLIEKMYQADFSEPQPRNKEWVLDAEEVSVEDKKILKLVNHETKFVDGHYHVPLPF